MSDMQKSLTEWIWWHLGIRLAGSIARETVESTTHVFQRLFLNPNNKELRLY